MYYLVQEATEHWRSVPGWEGLYEVSDQGRVRSLPRPTKTGIRGGRVLAPGRADDGRTVIGLCRDGKQLPRHIYVLVAAAFLGPCPPGMVICHGPAGNGDDSLANIRYDTPGSNRLDAIRAGDWRNQNAKKTCCPKCGGDYRSWGNGRRYCPPCRAAQILERKARKAAQVSEI